MQKSKAKKILGTILLIMLVFLAITCIRVDIPVSSPDIEQIAFNMNNGTLLIPTKNEKITDPSLQSDGMTEKTAVAYFTGTIDYNNYVTLEGTINLDGNEEKVELNGKATKEFAGWNVPEGAKPVNKTIDSTTVTRYEGATEKYTIFINLADKNNKYFFHGMFYEDGYGSLLGSVIINETECTLLLNGTCTGLYENVALNSTEERNQIIQYEESENAVKYSNLFNTSFRKFPDSLDSYSDSKNDVDSILSSANLDTDSLTIIGMTRYEKVNILLVELEGNIIEILIDDENRVLETSTLELKSVDSKQFSNEGYLMDYSMIELSELEIQLPNENETFIVNVLKISLESWEESGICNESQSKYVSIEGMYFIDNSDNVTVSGNSTVLSNCDLLPFIESEDETKNGNVAEYSNFARWEGNGLILKSVRESQITVDKDLNIRTMVSGVSFGMR